MVFDKMNAILFKAEHHWKTECRGKTKQKATIGIQNAFGIPAPTVLPVSTKIQNFIFIYFRRLLRPTRMFPKPEDLSCLGQDILRCMQFTEQVIHSFIIISSIHSFISLCQIFFDKEYSEDQAVVSEWSKTLISQIQVEYTDAKVTGLNPAWG